MDTLRNWDELPEDLRAQGEPLYDYASDYVGYTSLEGLWNTLVQLAKVHGDPSKLTAGEEILRRKVRPAIQQAHSDLVEGFDGFHRKQAWEGGSAEAFFDYSDRLVKAVDTVADSPLKIADAIRDYHSALTALWVSIVDKTASVLQEVVDSFMKLDDSLGEFADAADEDRVKTAKKVKGESILGAFSSYAHGLIKAGAAALTVDAEHGKATADVLAKLASAEEVPAGLNNVASPKGVKNFSYTGPTGYQLPMPTGVSVDPDWSATDIKHGRWVPKGHVKLALEPLMACVKSVRDNGAHWDKATQHQMEAFLAMPADAFSILGAEFYERLSAVMGRDHNLYLHSDERLNALADLLSRIGQAYGATDQEAADFIDRSYIATE